MPENFCPGKLVEVSVCKVYPETERCIKPAVVVTHSVLGKNSKSDITQDFLHCCKYVNRFKVKYVNRSKVNMLKCMTFATMMAVTSYTRKCK